MLPGRGALVEHAAVFQGNAADELELLQQLDGAEDGRPPDVRQTFAQLLDRERPLAVRDRVEDGAAGSGEAVPRIFEARRGVSRRAHRRHPTATAPARVVDTKYQNLHDTQYLETGTQIGGIGLMHTGRLRRILTALGALTLAGIATIAVACGGDGDNDNVADDDRLAVVASTTIVADLVTQVGGDHVMVTSIVPQGSDVHTFVITPSHIRLATEADLVVIVGAQLSVIEENLRESATGAVLTLTEGMALRPFPEDLAHNGHEDEDEHGHEDEDEHGHEDEDEHGHEDEDEHGHEDEDEHGHEDEDEHGHEDEDEHGHEDEDEHGHEDEDEHGHEDEDEHGHEDEDEHGHEDEDEHGHEDEDEHGHEDEDEHGHEDEDEHGHDHGSVDPHFWMDIDFAIQAVEAIRDELTRLDPENADGYRERAEAYIAELRALDGEIAALLAGLPAERRYLVTFHDAYGYFADRYGLTILGFVVEGPEEEPSAATIADLVERVTELGVPFIFTEPQFSARTIEQVARDSGAAIRTIPSGGLGEEYPSYVEFLRAIARGIAE